MPPRQSSKLRNSSRVWLSGRLKTAVFTDKKGKWCGSSLVEGDDILPQINPDWIRSFGLTQVEIRTAC